MACPAAAEQQTSGSGGIGALCAAARNPPADPTTRFDRKTVLIVGATSGIGHEAAIKFARLGVAQIIIGARNAARAEEAKALIASRSSFPLESISVHQVDFESLASVKSFVDGLDRCSTHIDVALISAGIAAPSYGTCASGWERSLQVDVFSTTLCAVLLLSLLQSSGIASNTLSVLEIVGSEAYLDVQDEWLPRDGTILDHYNKKASFSLERQYHIAKLLVMVALRGIVQVTKGKPHAPTIVVSSPGMCRTNLGRDFPFAMRAFMAVFQLFVARSAEHGSRSLVSGTALGPNASGHFWYNDALDQRQPLLAKASWDKAQPAEFTKMIDVIEESVPNVRKALELQP